MRRAREAAHVGADLGHHDLGDALADAGHAQRARRRLIESGHEAVHLPLDATLGAAQVVHVVQLHASQQGVVVVEAAHQRLDYGLRAPLRLGARQDDTR
jgi:hypothetical protein